MKKATALLLCSLTLLAACALRAGPPSGEGESAPRLITFGRSDWEIEADEVASVLAYHYRMSGLSAEEQRKEYAAQNAVYGRDKAELARLRLIVLLTLPGGAVRDEARLAALTESGASGRQVVDSPRRLLAQTLLRAHNERLRQLAQGREEARKHEAQLKDDLRERLDELGRRAEEQQRRAEEQQRRADELQIKLDKLIDIERELRRSPRRPRI